MKQCLKRGQCCVTRGELLYCKDTFKVNREDQIEIPQDLGKHLSGLSGKGLYLGYPKQKGDNMPTRVRCGTAVEDGGELQLSLRFRHVSTAPRPKFSPTQLKRSPLSYSWKYNLSMTTPYQGCHPWAHHPYHAFIGSILNFCLHPFDKLQNIIFNIFQGHQWQPITVKVKHCSSLASVAHQITSLPKEETSILSTSN